MRIKSLALCVCLLITSLAFGGPTYTVRNGDYDGAIAKKLGISESTLRKLNPGVKWRSLQIGQKLTIPGGSSNRSPVAKRSTSSAKPSKVGTYTVRSGDNDWIIARRHGMTVTALKSLNGGRSLTKLKPGQTLKVSGASSGKVAAKGSPATKSFTSRYGVIKGDNVSVRRGPGRQHGSLAQVDAGTRVTILSRDGDWVKALFPRGSKGWVRSDFLKAAPAIRVASRPTTKTAKTSKKSKSTYVAANLPTTGVDVLDRANRMRGVRYRYGAMSRSATDCSGFTKQVFASSGVRLPRTSREQASVGSKVSYGSMKAGDLVFFRARRGSRINHVGIYMGNGRFIHASSGGGKVQVNSFSDGYYASRFVTARRVAKVSGSSSRTASSSKPQPKVAAPAVTKPTVTADPEPEQEIAPPVRGTDEIIR